MIVPSPESSRDQVKSPDPPLAEKVWVPPPASRVVETGETPTSPLFGDWAGAFVGTSACANTGEARASSSQVPSIVAVLPLTTTIPLMVALFPAVLCPCKVILACDPSRTRPMVPW